MQRLKPDLTTIQSEPRVVVIFSEYEKNILLALLHHPMIDSLSLPITGKRFDLTAIKRFREMAHELER